MPVYCPSQIEPISTDDFRKLDYVVMGHIFASQNEIGRLADERVYQADIAERLRSAGIASEIEVPICVAHKTFTTELSLDLVVECRAVYELKTASALTSSHVAQLLTYQYLLDLPRGKLVNCRSAKVECQYVNAPIPRSDRCNFEVLDDRYDGGQELRAMVVDLIRDLGTSLSASLYQQALVNMMGGEASVERMLPLTRDANPLANQRFRLVDEASALELTTFANSDGSYEAQLQRLLELSPLRVIHWINIASHRISFCTVKRRSELKS
ncbi:MAG: GxxExxY protein [Pirellulaceae bacterium]